MTVLVTGAAGFIGANFVYHLLDARPAERVVGLDKLTYAGNLDNLSAISEACRERFTFQKADITDAEAIAGLFAKHDFAAVVNFAAETHVDRSIHGPQVFLETNILGTHVLLEACKKAWFVDGKWLAGHRFLQVSTDEVYGSLGPAGLFSESTPLDPHSPYSASKASADLVVQAYHDTYGMPTAITRCSNNYGPYQFPEKLIPLMIRNALAHEKLPVYGDGKHVRDWLHVSDHCRAIDLVLERAAPGSVYNIGGMNEHENIAIVKLIIKKLNALTHDAGINERLIQHVEDRLGHDRRYAIDASKIGRELGWRPQIEFAEGIESTVAWYLENRDWTE